MKLILVLENYRKSHPVFHLKTANTTKQMKLPFFEVGGAHWAHYSLTWSPWLFTMRNNPSYCPIHSQLGN